MEIRAISDAVAFSEEKMKKNALFDSPHLFYDEMRRVEDGVLLHLLLGECYCV